MMPEAGLPCLPGSPHHAIATLSSLLGLREELSLLCGSSPQPTRARTPMSHRVPPKTSPSSACSPPSIQFASFAHHIPYRNPLSISIN